MALNVFMKISNAKGESIQQDYVGWIQIQGWEWEIQAETSWTRGGGASVGKPSPGALSFEHFYDTASPAIMAYICMGKSFDTVDLHMCKTTGQAKLVPYMKAKLTDAFITKVNCATAEDGVVQKVEMVFKQIEIEYLPQSGKGSQTGQLGTGAFNYKWNISAGTVGGGGG